MSQWIDIGYGDANSAVGDTGYLVETRNGNTGREHLALRERPLRTNQSGVPRLRGWCGETDNQSRTAKGVAKIVRVNKAEDRAQIVAVTGADLAAFLEADGYPELIGDGS